MALTNQLELVIFDCDGVLVDSERLTVGVDVTVLSSMGWEMTADEAIERFLGRPDAYVTAELSRHIGRELPDDWDAVFHPLYVDALQHVTPVTGIEAALDAITIATCVASSGSHRKMRLTLGRTGLLDRFAGRIFSTTEVANGKPAPDLFLHAAARMGASPERCAVVEDSVAGVEAAVAAGMKAFGYSGSVTPADRLQRAGATVSDEMSDLGGSASWADAARRDSASGLDLPVAAIEHDDMTMPSRAELLAEIDDRFRARFPDAPEHLQRENPAHAR